MLTTACIRLARAARIAVVISGEIDMDGILSDGSKVPVFRKGEWVK